MSLLFVAGASGGSLTPTAAGQYRLALTGVEPSVTWFSDRPVRRAGREPLAAVVNHWAAFGFSSDPPNAALDVGQQATVLELTSPRYEPGAQSLTFEAKALSQPQEGLEFMKARLGQAAPASFGAADLFIDDVDVPAAVTPTGNLTSATPEPIVYVTFSGESSKGSANPINTVKGYAAGGESLDVLQKGPTLRELRGMTLGPDGSLYVANSYKKDTKIVLYGPPGADGTRAYVGDYAKHDSADPGLLHPYGLAFDGAGNLLVSSQDTCVVTVLGGSPGKGAPGPVAGWLQSNFAGHTFYPGTVVAESSAAKASDCSDASTTVDGGVQRPRGVAVGNGTLYVADNAGAQVRTYDLASGAPKGSLYPMADPNNPPSPAPAPVGLYLSGSTLYVSNEGTNDVWAIDTSTGAASQVIPTTTPAGSKTIVLDAPSGVTCGSDGALYLGNRKAQQLLRFDLAGRSASVFADKLGDDPEQIMAVAATPPSCSTA